VSDAAGGRLEVALETSTARPSVAARRAGRMEQVLLSGERQHASDLLPALQSALATLGAQPAEIAAVFVGVGPGSYTGLRVGVATALGLVRGTGAALCGVPSFEALAVAELASGQTCTVLLDARQGELYVARYRRDASGVSELLAPAVVATGSAECSPPSEDLILADDAALRAAGLAALCEREPARFRRAWPTAEHVLAIGAERLARFGPQDPQSIEPLYLRAFRATTRAR
jgi:tRNA threonylcarbamoyladenosine biosynthesis protein TsaB